MQTRLVAPYLDTPAGREAERILRACVHCGFCLATCPTYQLLGDERDSPRGRLYLIKQVFEGQPVTALTRTHLDRCLDCRNCETTCPSGVSYGQLLESGRRAVRDLAPPGFAERLRRGLLGRVIPYRRRFARLAGLGRLLRFALPRGWRDQLGRPGRPRPEPAAIATDHVMLILEGCVQPVLAPATNAAAGALLAQLGIALHVPAAAGCCGAASFHLGDEERARAFMRRNIDAWWPRLRDDAEALVVTASGCGAFIKEYGRHLADDPAYAEKAERIAALTRDVAEVVGAHRPRLEDLLAQAPAMAPDLPRRVAFHAPCTLRHWQRLDGVVEALLEAAGFRLTAVPDRHLCCGSAGTYSLLQPAIAGELGRRKRAALESGGPEVIVTANVGCQSHLNREGGVPVRHWIELLEERVRAANPETASGMGKKA